MEAAYGYMKTMDSRDCLFFIKRVLGEDLRPRNFKCRR